MAHAHTDTPRYLGGVLTRGSVVAGYRIERVIGTGRMGTIYLVQNPDLDRNDSLKVLNTEHLDDLELRTRFVREADVAARLSHPNIVTVYRRGTTDDGLLWIAMEYVHGADAEALLRRGLMTPVRAVRIVSEIAKGLDYAHRNNVIHRDVKPANFLVDTDPRTRRVLLADFGIAHSLGHDQPPTTGSLLATVAYTAPEVFNGAPVDGQADLYSLGCSLFRLLTRRAPFPNPGDTAAVIKSHLHDAPPKVTDFATDLPAALDDVIATALAKNPAQRFQSGRDLASAALSALQRRSPAPPRPPRRTPAETHERSPHAAPPADRHVVPPALEPALRFDPAVFTAMSVRARRSQHRRRRIALICALIAAVATLAGVAIWVSHPAALDNQSSSPTTAPGIQSVAPSASTDTDQRLRRMLPAGYAPSSCTPVASPDGAVAAVQCSANSDPGGPATARYLLMPNTDTLRSTFDAIVDDTSVVNCPGNIQSPVLCPTGVSKSVGELCR